MNGEDDQDRARIDELRSEITERLDELDELVTRVKGREQGGGRPHFTVIQGGRIGALALPLVAVVRRPRHQVAAALAVTVAGALAVVLAVPAHTHCGGLGDTTSYVSIPYLPPLSSTPGATAGSTPAATHGTPGATAAPSPTTAGATARPSPSRTPSAPSIGPSTPTPSASVPTPPASIPTAPTCFIRVGVTGVIYVCLR